MTEQDSRYQYVAVTREALWDWAEKPSELTVTPTSPPPSLARGASASAGAGAGASASASAGASAGARSGDSGSGNASSGGGGGGGGGGDLSDSSRGSGTTAIGVDLTTALAVVCDDRGVFAERMDGSGLGSSGDGGKGGSLYSRVQVRNCLRSCMYYVVCSMHTTNDCCPFTHFKPRAQPIQKHLSALWTCTQYNIWHVVEM